MVKTAKELSREDFESFEFQPKKKVREMFEKLMTATRGDGDGDEDEEDCIVGLFERPNERF